MEKLEVEEDDEPQGFEEPTGCTPAGFITFMIGLIGGTFSALLCKVTIYRSHSHFFLSFFELDGL